MEPSPPPQLTPQQPVAANTKTPKEVIDDALMEIAARVSLTEQSRPASHTAIAATGLDDPVVTESLARYAVGFLAGWVQNDATISDRLGMRGVDKRDEARRLVDRIVAAPDGLDQRALTLWRQTSRDPWIAEVLTHALFVIRRRTASDSLKGDVVAVLRPHPVPKRQGLDSVAIYDEDGVAVVAIGETKASCEHGSAELTHACDMFDSVDAGRFGPDLRNAIDVLANVLPSHLASQVSDNLWRDQRCYVPSIIHETAFDASLPRDRLDQLIPPVERKRVLVLRLSGFVDFFDQVATAMPAVIDELVV
jgi:hypothetical protein